MRAFDMDAGQLDLSMAIVEFHLADNDSGGRDGIGFPESFGVGAGLDSARADGLCGESVFDDAQYRRSIGTSVLTTMLVRKEQIQQSHLVDHVTVFDAWRLGQRPLAMPGGDALQLYE